MSIRSIVERVRRSRNPPPATEGGLRPTIFLIYKSFSNVCEFEFSHLSSSHHPVGQGDRSRWWGQDQRLVQLDTRLLGCGVGDALPSGTL